MRKKQQLYDKNLYRKSSILNYFPQFLQSNYKNSHPNQTQKTQNYFMSTCQKEPFEKFFVMSVKQDNQKYIHQVLAEYQDKIDEEDEFDQENQQNNLQDDFFESEQVKYYGYEDKKSITIKPVNMFKDFISLQKQNRQKLAQVKQLQKTNKELKQQYEACVKQSKNVQVFLKDIQFTFKNDKKSQKANEVMMKAKRMLYRQAQQCKNSMNKITKSAQANTIQQTKMYIELLQKQKQRLLKFIEKQNKINQAKLLQEDFNMNNMKKFQKTCQTVQSMLNRDIQQVKRHQQIYKIQKMMVSTGLKQKQIEIKKKGIMNSYESLKDLLLKQQGEQYQIQVLQKKKKDKSKIVEEVKKFKDDISWKEKRILVLQKELKDKMKSYDYMSKWTKQLKFKLQQRKESHINVKITYEHRINMLSKQFQEWNRKYKAELVQDNFIKKKGTVKEIYHKDNQVERIKKIRVIKFQEIKDIAKSLAYWIVKNELNLQEFIRNHLLKVNTTKLNKLAIAKKHIKSTFSITQKQQNVNKIQATSQSLSHDQLITMDQLIQNFKQVEVLQDCKELIKFARYIIQDNNINYSRVDSNTSVSIQLAVVVLKNLLGTQLKSHEDIQLCKEQLKKFITKSFDPVRHDLKCLAGKEQIIDQSMLFKIFRKHAIEQFYVLRFKQLIQYLCWNEFGCVNRYKMNYFDKICEDLVKKKLVKQKKAAHLISNKYAQQYDY